MKTTTTFLAAVTAGLALSVAFPAWPAGGEPAEATATGSARGSSDPDYQAGVAAWKAKAWPEVITRMNAAVQREPNNADAWNLLGHAYRNTGDLDNSFKAYGRALEIDPKHRAAHEYVGEAYLQAGNLPKAEEHLKTLDRLCRLPCEEYTDLKKKVAAYRRDHPN